MLLRRSPSDTAPRWTQEPTALLALLSYRSSRADYNDHVEPHMHNCCGGKAGYHGCVDSLLQMQGSQAAPAIVEPTGLTGSTGLTGRFFGADTFLHVAVASVPHFTQVSTRGAVLYYCLVYTMESPTAHLTMCGSCRSDRNHRSQGGHRQHRHHWRHWRDGWYRNIRWHWNNWRHRRHWRHRNHRRHRCAITCCLAVLQSSRD